MDEQKIRIRSFGIVAEIIGSNVLDIHHMANTDELQAWLLRQYPALEKQAFSMALNQSMLQTQTALTPGDEIALLPPFSGG
jgi:molybdopterin converting factor small subunit